ncbi:MAG: hypothetical protein EA370_10115 [Wenzhouxiangella sp.]|nr:MAG: hypothetical protein EA370_10115 [Wenzhouxiangella sp.]
MTEPNYYLSLFPQALIASMLDPPAFGSYYAVGTQVNSREEAMFFEVDPHYLEGQFDLAMARRRCVADAHGNPKRSVYLSIHETLARIPVAALGRLHLVTSDGVTLPLAQAEEGRIDRAGLFLYQELCPVTPLVVSRLAPHAFCEAITAADEPIRLPRLVFADLELGELAVDPVNGRADNLPYPNLEHLRDVLSDFMRHPEKCSKLFQRRARGGLPYRMIKHGIYVGDHEHFAFYPFPSLEALETTYRSWWRSAQFSTTP